MLFSSVIGQDEVKQRMLQMVHDDRVPHAMMLCGATGYGTLALAVSLASYLLGQREEATPPHIEAMISKLQHPDLHFVYPVIRPKGTPSGREITSDDFAREWNQTLLRSPYITIEDWLMAMNAENEQAQIFAAEGDAISHKLSLKSSQGGYKVCVIWLPERMHTVFANKILKLLEEPPQQTVFIMASEEPEKLLETIRSRVQRIDIKRITTDAIATALQQKRGIEQELAARFARMAEGNWIKAVGMLDADNEASEFHKMFVLLMRCAYQRDTKTMKRWAEACAKVGREKQRRMLTYFSSQLRENFMSNFQEPRLVYMTPEEEAFSARFARFINEANIIELSELMDHAIKAIGQNAEPKLQLFDLALKTAALIRRQ